MKNIVDKLVNIGNVDCEELARILPLAVRVIPELDGIREKLECQPHDGEHSRFGVFFHAIANEEDLMRFPADKPKIVLATSDLFARTGISGDLKNSGVLVFPSQQYQSEIDKTLNGSMASGRGRLCLWEQIGIDRSVQGKHITLDVASVSQGRLPILSIPQRILISMDLIKK